MAGPPADAAIGRLLRLHERHQVGHRLLHHAGRLHHLACNNYEIIDLGVMVPAAKILDTARKENVDIVGLPADCRPPTPPLAAFSASMNGIR
jgi:cobalamin-dependent methionine synthase I